MNRCKRCGYSWRSHADDPARCPKCKSTRWNSKTIMNICQRCDATWEQRTAEAPRYCPQCHSTKWNIQKKEFICQKCGKTRILKANSREGLCPDCDRYDHNIKSEIRFNDYRQAVSSNQYNGKLDHELWSEGNVILRYVADDNKTAYLWENGKMIAHINFAYWCGRNGITPDLYISRQNNGYKDPSLGELVGKMRVESGDYLKRAESLMELHGISEMEAKVYSLYDLGLDMMPISLKLNISYTEVRRILENAREDMTFNARGRDLLNRRSTESEIRVGKRIIDDIHQIS